MKNDISENSTAHQLTLPSQEQEFNVFEEEAEQLEKWWKGGYFLFLSSRTNLEYKHRGVSHRRKKIESAIRASCPLITDKVLEQLYEEARKRYYEAFKRRFPNTNPFTTTPSERTALATIRKITENSHRYDSVSFSPLNADDKAKLPIGCHVPDVLILGLKKNKCSAIALEIMGPIHMLKGTKDQLFFNHMAELGITVYPIDNEKASDIEFIRGVLNSLNPANTSKKLKEQTLRLKRKIWAKTISTFMSLKDIEQFVQERFDLTLSLELELQALLAMPDCPRLLRNEAKRNRFWRPSVRVTKKGNGVIYTLEL